MELGLLYADARVRIADLVGPLDAREAETPVAACPGWTVHDVIAHLTATADDVVAGRLGGPPDDTWTAAQVARHRGTPVSALLEEWESRSSEFEGILDAFTVWPGVIDVLSHEHDIRTALGRPGARDCEGVRQASSVVMARLQPPVPLVVHVEDESFTMGLSERSSDPPSPPLELRTSRFEAFRFRMGRRSRAQMTAMDWSRDPAPVLESLMIMGPATTDLVE